MADGYAGLEEVDPVRARSIPNLLVLLVMGIAGAAVGPVLVVKVFDAFRGTSITARLWEWVFILGIETAFWALTVVPVWRSARRLWRYTGAADAEIAMLAGFVALLGLLAGLPLYLAKNLGFFAPLDRQFTPLAILVVLGCAVAAPGVIGVWLVDRCVARKLRPDGGVAQIGTFLQLRRYLDAYRSFLGIMLALVVLAAGAQRTAINAAFPETGFRPVFVLLFGVYNTILLVLVYVPTYLRLVSTGREIVDGIQPLPKDVEELEDALARRKTLVDLFGLDLSATEKLKSALFLLAPVFSSVVVAIAGVSAD